MKKSMVKHWAIIFVALTAIALLLLCGAAQACDKLDCWVGIKTGQGEDFLKLYNCGQVDIISADEREMLLYSWKRKLHPDSVWMFSDTLQPNRVVHRRTINSDDWCARVDTITRARGGFKIESWYEYKDDYDTLLSLVFDTIWGSPRFDTTWVLCCDSAARKLVGITKTVRWDLDTLPWDSWVNHPERWYIESVDTLCPLHNVKGFGVFKDQDRFWNDTCDINSFIFECGYLFKTDTTWAKKIPLSEEYLTPDDWRKLRKLISVIEWCPDNKCLIWKEEAYGCKIGHGVGL
jgi:hypothetical protein